MIRSTVIALAVATSLLGGCAVNSVTVSGNNYAAINAQNGGTSQTHHSDAPARVVAAKAKPACGCKPKKPKAKTYSAADRSALDRLSKKVNGRR